MNNFGMLQKVSGTQQKSFSSGRNDLKERCWKNRAESPFSRSKNYLSRPDNKQRLYIINSLAYAKQQQLHFNCKRKQILYLSSARWMMIKGKKKCYTYNEALWLRRALSFSFAHLLKLFAEYGAESSGLSLYIYQPCLPSHVLLNIVHKYNDANRYIELEHTTQKYTPIKTKLGYFNEI